MNQGEGQYDCNTIQQAGSAGNASCMLESTLIPGQVGTVYICVSVIQQCNIKESRQEKLCS